MTGKKGSFELGGITVGYKELGTVSIEEMTAALIADMHALRDIYNVRYVKGSRLRLFVTNEYGEEIKVNRPAGGTVQYIDTHHFRPSCLDYKL